MSESIGRKVISYVRSGRLFSFRFAALYVALAVNTCLLAAYFWSAGGATTHVRFQAINGVYTAFVDGKREAEARCDQYNDGGIVVKTNSESPAASLPEPRGLNRLLVTDSDSGEVLFDSRVNGIQSESTPDGWDMVTVGDSSWHNYVVDAYLKNPADAEISLHATNYTNGIVYFFRPFRHLDDGIDYLVEGQFQTCPITWATTGDGQEIPPAGNAPGFRLELSRVETLKSMIAMVMRPYPYLLGGLFVMLALTVGLHLMGLEKRLRGIPLPSVSVWAGAFVRALAVAVFALLLWIIHNVNQAMPHVPDEVSYIFQAKLLASFHLTTAIPQAKEGFDFFYPSLLYDSGGRWASIYPFGHPIMLAIGQLIGAVWLVPPIIGALCVVLIFVVGRRLYGTQAGVVAAVLLAFSPFFQMNASNFMSHNTAAFYILACLTFLTVGWRRKAVAYGLAGICFGLLLNTRPLTAAALVVPFALLFASDIWVERGHHRAVIVRSFSFAGGVMLMVAAFYLYNLGTTGALNPGYGTTSSLETAIGFGQKNSVARGMLNEQAQLSSLLVVLNGWPLFVGLSFVLLPFVLGSRSRWDLFLLLGALFAVGVWTLYESNGLMYGPRYWYEAMPFLMLLAARGFVMLQKRLSEWASMIVRRRETGPPLAIGRVMTYSVLLALLAYSVHGWMLGKHFDTAANDYEPRSISELKGFNDVDDRLAQKVAAMHLHNALVLVQACPNWQCYGTVFWRNDIDFDGDVIYARDVPEMRAVLGLYSDRQIYVANVDENTVTPLNPSASSGG